MDQKDYVAYIHPFFTIPQFDITMEMILLNGGFEVARNLQCPNCQVIFLF